LSPSQWKNLPPPSPEDLPSKTIFLAPDQFSEGRTRHAPEEGATPTTTLPPFGHGPLADPGVTMTCPGLRRALFCGRAERIPPRKPPFASSRAFPRKAILPWMAHLAEGRAPHARKERHRLDPGHVPIRPPGVPLPPMIMLCLGSLAASECGRTECVPPRKPPSAASRGFPRKAILPWMAHPAEGRAPHACKKTLPPPGDPPLGHACLGPTGTHFLRRKISEKTAPNSVGLASCCRSQANPQAP
jgi:hypothetical protein